MKLRHNCNVHIKKYKQKTAPKRCVVSDRWRRKTAKAENALTAKTLTKKTVCGKALKNNVFSPFSVCGKAFKSNVFSPFSVFAVKAFSPTGVFLTLGHARTKNVKRLFSVRFLFTQILENQYYQCMGR